MNEDEIKQLQRQVSKLQLEAKLRKSVANELERQKNLVQQAKEEAEEQRAILEVATNLRSNSARREFFRDTERQKILNGLLLRYC
jgi:isopropylmalate/homocitrate/citramalate synthase